MAHYLTLRWVLLMEPEICQLVGLFLLNNLTQLVGSNNIDLYRDDGLAILENASGPSSERIKKRIIKLFQHHGLKITAETNLVQTNFLDVTLDLKSGRYFRKPNDQPLYKHRLSNHLPVIKKQLPLMLATRLSQLSCDSKEFSNAVPEYVDAMQRSGHTGKLEYADNLGSKKKKRKRDITWFNPPFSEHVKTNIGKEFLRLLAKHFPLHHRLHKICNKFNVKVSYSCMPNMAAIISKHNKIVLSNKTTANSTTPPCNCRNKVSCPLEGKCRESSVGYKACLISGNAANNYYGCCETEFKARFYNHNQSFKYRRKSNATELSKVFWQAKDAGKNPRIKWSIVAHTAP